ncbi:hypothetical protein [Parasitella parasitica]|uniref:BZIP domain-containing protein n=1 Tax=Parasitella parasitica TaxID=35722 RepID=A0A0B7NJH5_9FUNG|nr:hypothetical protein [Parasitella parasitica]
MSPTGRRLIEPSVDTVNSTTNKASAAAKGPIKKAKKPGRKPLESVNVLPSDPKLKRKAQNRAAQRAFRERKEQFVNQLQDQMRQLREAKEKREKELSAENARLKKENEKLKEENYLLKDTQFPQTKSDYIVLEKTDKSQPIPLVSPPNTDGQKMLSSPEMDSQSQAETSIFGCGCEDGSKCGELSDYQGSSASDFMSETSLIQGAETREPAFTFDSADLNSFSLFNGKANPLLNDYRTPSNEVDFVLQGEPLPALFGAEMDLFGATMPSSFDENVELDAFVNEQMQTLVEQDALRRRPPENEKPCKMKILGMLRRARGTNRSLAEINQDVKSFCPDFNLDQLCDDLKKKITLDPHHTLTDDDVDLYIECIQRNA